MIIRSRRRQPAHYYSGTRLLTSRLAIFDLRYTIYALPCSVNGLVNRKLARDELAIYRSLSESPIVNFTLSTLVPRPFFGALDPRPSTLDLFSCSQLSTLNC